MTLTLVLGAGGQDGRYLTEAFVRRGQPVVGIIRREPRARLVSSHLVKYLRCDLRDQRAYRSVIESIRPDVVFHFAAVHGASGFVYEPLWEDLIAVNVHALQTTLEYARLNNPDLCVVYAGSSKVFPWPWFGTLDEQTPMKASCLYSMSKVLARDVGHYYHRVHGVRTSHLTVFNHESPYRPSEYLLQKIARAIKNAKTDQNYKLETGNLNFKIDWSSAEEMMDIASEIPEKAAGEDFVLASGVTVHARTVIYQLFRAHDLDPGRHIVERDAKGDVVPDFTVSLARLERMVGRRPQRGFFEVMDSMVRAIS